MHYTLGELQHHMYCNGGDLNLRGFNLTQLPDGLVVEGGLDASFTPLTSLPIDLLVKGSIRLQFSNIKELPEGLIVNGNLNVSHTPITHLPDHLHVKGSLQVMETNLTSLPKGLIVEGWLNACNTSITHLPSDIQIGGSLYLNDTPLSALPENLVVNGDLGLRNTKLTSLPTGLMVRNCLSISDTAITSLPHDLKAQDSLDISNTPIQSLPKHLYIGNWLYLHDTHITKLPKGLRVRRILSKTNQLTNPNDYTKWQQGDYKENEYIYADGILTLIKRTRQVGAYTFYQGRFPNEHVVTDGVYYAHCETLKEGLRDIAFKHAKNRGTENYKHLTINDTLSADEAMVMYRVITGACQAGVDSFVCSLDELKETYTIHEILSLTEGYYGHEAFQKFFCQTA